MDPRFLSTGRNTGRGKVAYSWISPDPAKVGSTLGGGGGGVAVNQILILNLLL